MKIEITSEGIHNTYVKINGELINEITSLNFSAKSDGSPPKLSITRHIFNENSVCQYSTGEDIIINDQSSNSMSIDSDGIIQNLKRIIGE